MQGIALTSQGIEKITSQELEELGAEIQTIRPGAVFFHAKDLLELCKIAYSARSVTKLLRCLGTFSHEGNPLDALARFGRTVPWREIISPGSTFVIRTAKFVDEPSSPELCQTLEETINISATLDYRNPAHALVVVLEQQQISIGLELGAEDLAKRPYRVFLDPAAVKGHIAYAMARYAGFCPGKTLLDPFCKSGIIPIEAALWVSGKSPHFYAKDSFAFKKLPLLSSTNWDEQFTQWDAADPKEAKIIAMDDSFRYVQASKKNAKIAGVMKEIEFSRTDLEWLDTKCPKGSVDCIATIPPQPSSHIPPEKVEKELREFLHQAVFIGSKNLRIVLLMRRGKELVRQLAEHYKLALKEETAVQLGKDQATLMLLQRA